MVIGIRQRIIEDTDGQSSKVIDLSNEDDEDGDADDAEHPAATLRGPSKEAIAKFTDYSAYTTIVTADYD